MPLRALLKDGTQRAHERLERLLHLDSSALTRTRYGEYLRFAQAFHASMEPAFEHEPLTRFGLDMRERRKAPWLAEDLRALGLEPLPPPPVAAESDAIRLLGRAYVMEGATLGGRVLLERVEARFDARPGAGATYLAGYAADTGRMWKGFVAALDAAALTDGERESCVDAARATFEAYERLLRDGGWD